MSAGSSGLRHFLCLLPFIALFVAGAAFGESGDAGAPNQGHARGAVIPPVDRLQAHVNAQAIVNKRMEFALSVALGEKRQANPGASLCSVSARHFDWRDHLIVTEVENQYTCGDCWAFATAAALEASYLLVNHEKVTDAQSAGNSDFSEQQVLDCTSPGSATENSCAGGWHDAALDYTKSSGIWGIKSYGSGTYNDAKAKQCLASQKAPNLISTWNYVGDGVIPPDNDIKAAICAHGPVVTAVNAENWDSYTKTINDPATNTQKPNPVWPNGGVFTGTPSPSKNLSWQNIQSKDIDHEVVLVGWDDDKNAWIVKNSWGKDWGIDGYMLLQRGTANVGFNSAWVDVLSRDEVSSLAAADTLHLKHIAAQKSYLFGQELQVIKQTRANLK